MFGCLRRHGPLEVPVDISESDAIALAMAARNVQRHLTGAEIRRVVDRRPKLVNLVV